MTASQQASLPSRCISVLLSPRETIERIVAGQPRRFVLLLASLGTIASILSSLIASGLAGLLTWPILLAIAAACILLGIAGLYVNALIFKWMGRLIGGRASAVDLRAVLAWSAVPSLIGLFIVLAILAASGFFGTDGGAVPEWPGLLMLAVTGLVGIWSIVVLMLMLSRVLRFGFWRTIAVYVLAQVLVYSVIVFPVLIRTLLFQPFNSPSSSMSPTLLNGDYFFVSKFAYGYSHYSLPYSPRLFAGRIFGAAPQAGDVVVFRTPKNDSVDYVKRVVGLPGDRIQMKEGLLYINDKPVMREPLPDFVGNVCGGNSDAHVKRWREKLPNGASYETLDCLDNGFYDNTSLYTVPADHFFVLGDNRDNSTDSRVLSSFGYIPFENLIGRVELIFFSRAEDSTIRSERIGTEVR